MGKLLHHCFEFPNCSCMKTIRHCTKVCNAWSDWDAEIVLHEMPIDIVHELRFAEYFALRCIAANARSRKWRAWAEMLLKDPIVYGDLWKEYP
jgi:hypothetical protein